MQHIFLVSIVFSLLVGCNQPKNNAPKDVESSLTQASVEKINDKLSTVFSLKGSVIPSSVYKSLGVENQFGDLYTDTMYTTSKGNQMCVFSDLPTGCTDFYCYANYYVALVNNNACKSLISVPITLGSKPSVEYVEGTYLCISNEVEQYSSKEGSHSASITDDIVDFKKSFTVSDNKLVEVEI